MDKNFAEILVGQLGQIQIDMSEMHKEIRELKEQTNRVEVQTTKTNGRVTRLEEHTTKCPVANLTKELTEVQDQVYEIIEEKKIKNAVDATKDTTEFKSGSLLKTAAIVAGWIVGIGALFSGLIYIKDIL